MTFSRFSWISRLSVLGVFGLIGSFVLPVPVSAQSLYALLPRQTKDCWQSGNCQLDDILRTGVAFANLLIGLSAAAFFATFVYGGFMYLMSFGSKEYVGKGKKALTGAAIGMIIVMSSWTIVNYLASTITGRPI